MTMKTGRAATYHGYKQPFRISEYAVPEPEPGAALVRMTLANVCGSDLHLWRGELDPAKRGRALPQHQGHEGTGRIEALGEGVTTDSNGEAVAVGDRVVFAYFFPCGSCRVCIQGQEWACPKRMSYRGESCDVWPYFKGTFGDYMYLYPNHFMFKVPDSLPDELVVGVNCAMSQVTAALDVAGMGFGDTVVIQGAGGLGLYAIAVARERGAGRIIVIDGVHERLEVAEMFGADELVDMREITDPVSRIRRVKELTGGWGGDVVLELAGFPAVTDEGIQMVRPAGTYLEIGNISPGLTYVADPAYWVTQNVKIIGNNHYGRKHLSDALQMLDRTRQKYPFDRIVSHKFPLEEINEVFEAQAKGDVTRSSLVM